MHTLETFQRRLNMKRAAVLTFALLLGSIALAAQTARQDQTSFGVSRMEGLSAVSTINPYINIGCPISLRALHGASGDMLKVDRSRPQGIAQLIHLILTNLDSRRIVAARVRVHGITGKGHITQTKSSRDESDASANLVVRFPDGPEQSAGPGKDVSGDLWVPGMTAVLSIDLNSVTFADGSTWSFAGREACHVAPDKLMLIAGR
jgi:hypothetical protein